MAGRVASHLHSGASSPFAKGENKSIKKYNTRQHVSAAGPRSQEHQLRLANSDSPTATRPHAALTRWRAATNSQPLDEGDKQSRTLRARDARRRRAERRAQQRDVHALSLQRTFTLNILNQDERRTLRGRGGGGTEDSAILSEHTCGFFFP